MFSRLSSNYYYYTDQFFFLELLVKLYILVIYFRDLCPHSRDALGRAEKLTSGLGRWQGFKG